MRIELLTKESSKKGKCRRFERLLDYFNSHIFPAGDDGLDECKRMKDEEVFAQCPKVIWGVKNRKTTMVG
jgi:hypothetical protein